MGSKGKSFFLKKKNLVHRATVHSLGIFDWKVFSIFTARERTSEVDLGIFFFFINSSTPDRPTPFVCNQFNPIFALLISYLPSLLHIPHQQKPLVVRMYLASVSVSAPGLDPPVAHQNSQTKRGKKQSHQKENCSSPPYPNITTTTPPRSTSPKTDEIGRCDVSISSIYLI